MRVCLDVLWWVQNEREQWDPRIGSEALLLSLASSRRTTVVDMARMGFGALSSVRSLSMGY